MEPMKAAVPDGAPAGERLAVGRVLSEAWKVLSRNALPILGTALVLELPSFASTQLPSAGSDRAALGLLVSLAATIGSMARVGAVTLAGQQALQGAALDVQVLVLAGLRRAWLVFKTLVLSMWWCALLVAAVFLLVRWLVAGTGGWVAAPEVQYWLMVGAAGTATVVARAWYFPAFPVALATPERGARHAVRVGRQLTRGARARLLGTALALQCLVIPTWLLYHWASKLPAGETKVAAFMVHTVLFAAVSSLAGVAAVIVYRDLRREKQWESEGLERVFE